MRGVHHRINGGIAIATIHPALIPATTPREAAEFLLSPDRHGGFVVTLNVELIARALCEPEFRQLVAAAPYRVCDGVGGVLLLSRGHRTERIPRIAGIDLGMEVLRLAAERGMPVFFLGGREGIARRAAKRLCGVIDRLAVAGVYHGYFPACDEAALRGMIARSGAQIVIVCLGSPKQEAFAAECCRRLPAVKLCLPLGGSLDVWAGEIPRAPRILRDAGLEWLWRIALEPSRIGRLARSSAGILRAVSAEFQPKCVRIEKRM